jgi:hypothetical protein
MSQTAAHFKKCSICGKRKPLDAFTVRSRNKDGHTTYCRVCIGLANRRRYQARSQQMRERLKGFNKKLKDDKSERVFNYLREHPCVDCGETDPVVLEFDHRDPCTKKLYVAQMIERRYAWAKIEAEIEKCDVRCANCHRRKTSRQFGHRRSLLQRKSARTTG